MSKIIDFNKVFKQKEKRKKRMDILFAIIIIYIVYAVYLIMKTPTDTINVESSTLTAEESATGFIIREETVVKGKNYKNGINAIVQEGERAAKKQVIFRYYGQNESNLQSKISEVNEKIQKAMQKENTIFPTDMKNLEKQIDKEIDNIKTTRDTKKLAEYKKQISEIMLKKAMIAGENSKSGSYIKKLISQREGYEKKLMEGSEYVAAPNSGVVSYRVDGLEETLKADGFDNITEDKLNELDVKTGQIISSSNESAKVINNFACYIVTILDSEYSRQAEVGKNVQVTLSNNAEIDATIDYKKEQEDGKILVAFKLKTLTEELLSHRKVSFNITWWSVAGIKVPNDAILEDEKGLKYVLRKTLNGTSKCFVNVKKSNDKYSIISSYSTQDLQKTEIDITDYKGIEVHDIIMLYPQK